MAFSEQPHTIEPPTDDHDEVAAMIDSLAADGGTATGDGLAAALNLIDGRGERRAPAAVVLLSDGKATTGRDPLPVARQAKRLGIPISTVALGSRGAVITTPSGALLAVPPDPETMRQIAELSGGRAYEVDDADDLSEVYESLGLPSGDQEGAPRGHLGLRGGRRAAAAGGGGLWAAGHGAAAVDGVSSGGGTRTHNPSVNSRMLCRLSYPGMEDHDSTSRREHGAQPD